jgi:hypothetical protein
MKDKKLFKYVGTNTKAIGMLLMGSHSKFTICGVIVSVPDDCNEDSWFTGAEVIDWNYEDSSWVDVTDCKIELIEPPVTYSVGDRFDTTADGEERTYILVSTGIDEVILSSLSTGNRWTSKPIKIERCNVITVDEFEKISEYGDFTKVEK